MATCLQSSAYAEDNAARLSEIDSSLKKLEASQKEILTNQQEILEKLKQLKIWVRRN